MVDLRSWGDALAQNIIAGAVSLLVPFCAGWIREHIAALKFGRLQGAADMMVRAVEQTARDMTSEEKRAAAVNQLAPRFLGYDRSLIRAAVEAAVLELNRKPTPATVIDAGTDVVTVTAGPPPNIEIKPQ